MKEKYIRFRARLHEIQTVEELVEVIPVNAVCTVALVLLGLLCLLPCVVRLTYDPATLVFLDEGEESWSLLSYHFPFTDHWYYLLKFICRFTLFIGAYALLAGWFGAKKRGLDKKALLSENRLVVGLGATLAWACLSFAFSGNWRRCFEGTGYRHDGLLSYILYAGVFLTAAVLAYCAEHRVKLLLEIFAAGGTFTAVLALNLPVLNDLFGLEAKKIAASVFSNSDHYGYYLTLCLPVIVLLFLLDDHKNKLWVLRLVQLWFISNAASVNERRGCFVGLVAAFFALHLLYFKNPTLRKRLLVADGIVLATLTVFNTGGDVFNRFLIIFHSGSQAEPEDIMKTVDHVGGRRIVMGTKGLQFALERPLFGYGPDNLGERYFAYDMTYTDRPHNEYIQIAASLGFPALATYLYGLGAHYKEFWAKRGDVSLLCGGLFCVLFGYLASAFFGNSMFYTTPYFFMLLGLSLGLLRKEGGKAGQQ